MGHRKEYAGHSASYQLKGFRFLLIMGIWHVKTTIWLRHTVVGDSINLDHLGFFDVHLNLRTWMFSAFHPHQIAAAVARIRSHDLVLSSPTPLPLRNYNESIERFVPILNELQVTWSWNLHMVFVTAGCASTPTVQPILYLFDWCKSQASRTIRILYEWVLPFYFHAVCKAPNVQ